MVAVQAAGSESRAQHDLGAFAHHESVAQHSLPLAIESPGLTRVSLRSLSGEHTWETAAEDSSSWHRAYTPPRALPTPDLLARQLARVAIAPTS